MANPYHKGQMVRISVSFSLNGVDTDPTTITFKVKTPAGVTNTYTYALGEVTKDATGKYHKDISGNEVGMWNYATIGTGTVEAVDENYYEILPSVF